MVLLYALQLIAYKGEQCLWKMSVFSQQLAEMGVVYIIDTTYIGNVFVEIITRVLLFIELALSFSIYSTGFSFLFNSHLCYR